MSISDSLKRVAVERDELLKKLPWHKRFKERFFTKEHVATWQVSSWVTIGQLTGLAWLWKFAVSKLPWLGSPVGAITTGVSKLWSGITALATGSVAVVKEVPWENILSMFKFL